MLEEGDFCWSTVKKEGILKNYMYQNDVPHDTNVYSLLKSI
ncbi:hypothetical protein BTH41_02504 [Bacillus mycoides]|nr:hypothetical protein BTH41_02504 [Bacillus mycoides]